MSKYKMISHVTGADGSPIAAGSIVDAADLGDAALIKRYQELGAIEDPSKEDLAAAAEAPAVGGSIVGNPAEIKETVAAVAEKSADKK